MSSDARTLAGRLHEKCLELLAGADIQFRRHNRLDVALVKNHPIALYAFPIHGSYSDSDDHTSTF